MRLHSKTYHYQSNLSSYCRSGVISEELKEIKKDNVVQYRELTYGLVFDTIDSAYPLTSLLLEGELWDKWINLFFANHDCKTPLIWEMPKEFLTFVTKTSLPLKSNYPFLIDLLTLEWLEIEVFMMKDVKHSYQISTSPINLEKDLLIINPEFKINKLDYPVHLKKASTIKEIDKGEYYLCTHRHDKTGDVFFTNLSPAFVSIIKELSSTPFEIKKVYNYLESTLKIKVDEKTKQIISNFIIKNNSTHLILPLKK